ncbi:MAG: 23S rRNA (pseudouridine(1915)-N(3))-methyltransferase RlmH [Pseudomonadota bacterium]
MNLLILSVGKCAGPEADLCARYLKRAGQAGRSVGIRDVTVRELPDRTGPSRTLQESDDILSKRSPGALVALDERGALWTSTDFAGRLQAWADHAVPSVTFAIGGADGHAQAVRSAADATMALSKMTLPHQLARVILLEQIYRAITICAGHPYHRA